MNKAFFHLMCLSALALTLAGCALDEIVYPEGSSDVAATYLELDKLSESPVTLSSIGGTYTLKVCCRQKWTLTTSSTWCSTSTKQGLMYTQVPISFQDNPKDTEREALFTFTENETGNVHVLSIIQEAAETKLATNESEFAFGLAGGTKSFELITNSTDWKAEIRGSQGSDASWLTLSRLSGDASVKLDLTAGMNKTGATRSADIILTAGDKTVIVKVTQDAVFATPAISLISDNEFRIEWDDILGVGGY